jgi:hypothetical protein
MIALVVRGITIDQHFNLYLPHTGVAAGICS